MNKVFLIGNLTRDPELSETGSGISVCRFSIAVNRDYTNADGERETDFSTVLLGAALRKLLQGTAKKGTKSQYVGAYKPAPTRGTTVSKGRQPKLWLKTWSF